MNVDEVVSDFMTPANAALAVWFALRFGASAGWSYVGGSLAFSAWKHFIKPLLRRK